MDVMQKFTTRYKVCAVQVEAVQVEAVQAETLY